MVSSVNKSILILLFFIILLVSACNTIPEKYSDVKDVLNKMIKTYEVFIDEVDEVKDAKEVKKAIYKFIDNMNRLDNIGIELQIKYPELNDDDKIPKYLIDIQDKLIKTATGERTKATSIIILSYVHDPEVKEAADMLSKFLDGN